MNQHGVKIVSTGSYLPEKVLTNFDLEKIVDTSDEWIRTRTGIETRHIAAENESTSDLGTQAALRALDKSDLEAGEIELIIVATLSPDTVFPNTACYVQEKIGAMQAVCFSIEAACSGFVYALEVAGSMIRSGIYTNALVIGAEKLSSLVNWEDRTTCVLFGDGAGAAILQRCAVDDNAMLTSKLGSDGRYTGILHVPRGGSAAPLTKENFDEKMHYLAMSGQEVFKLAVSNMSAAAVDVLEHSGLSVDDIRWVVPHQANTRIINAIAKKLKIPDEKVYINVNRFGNTSAASIPIALDELSRNGELKTGDHILFVAFGGGLTWGASIIRWS